MLTEFRFRTAVPTRVLIPPPKRRMKRRMKRRRMKRATRRCIRGRTNRPLLVGHRPDQRTDSGTTRHAGINRCRTRSFGPSSRLMAHYRYNTVVPAPCLLEGLGKGRPCLRLTARGASRPRPRARATGATVGPRFARPKKGVRSARRRVSWGRYDEFEARK